MCIHEFVGVYVHSCVIQNLSEDFFLNFCINIIKKYENLISG